MKVAILLIKGNISPQKVHLLDQERYKKVR